MKPPTFSGDGIEDVNDFITRFQRMTEFYRWDDEIKLRALPLYHTGNASVWFNSHPRAALNTWDAVLTLLKNHFDSGTSQWLLRQQLDQRVQGKFEPLAQYTADIRCLCQRLKLPKSEWLHQFVRGLRGPLKEYVVLQSPADFETAETQARLRDAVSGPPTDLATVSDELTKRVINGVTGALAKTIPSSNPSKIAAYEPTPDPSRSPHRPGADNLTRDDIRLIIQQELRKELRRSNPPNQNYDLTVSAKVKKPPRSSVPPSIQTRSQTMAARNPESPESTPRRIETIETLRTPHQQAPDVSPEVLRSLISSFDHLRNAVEYKHLQQQNSLAALETTVGKAATFWDSGLKPPTFSGDGIEDDDERKLQALPLYHTGNASVWFNSHPMAALNTWDAALTQLKNHFDSGASQWLLRQQLDQRVQGKFEPLAQYTADIRRLCQRLKLPKSEWLHQFVRGLRGPLKEYVVLQSPADFETAETQARLRDAVSGPPTDLATVSDELTKRVINGVTGALAKTIPSSNPSKIAAYEPTPDPSRSPHRPGADNLTRDDIRLIIQQELRKELRRSNPPNQNYDRNRRTYTGIPICSQCNTRGHTAYSCRARDSRIPNPRNQNPTYRPSFQRPQWQNNGPPRRLNQGN
ncbi:predicted protein [Nematostella vectensis]|uniref:Retrotransposon gag domain-containing protein n=1 Tax=Nematostella vectensis TaxID=45351 RepID=A7SBT4_NEMVE|nr:predicted protein [Nematostella vectensis]|eukprot:XP_001630910.1 predicted protein [Nematostella vectensis]